MTNCLIYAHTTSSVLWKLKYLHLFLQKVKYYFFADWEGVLGSKEEKDKRFDATEME